MSRTRRTRPRRSNTGLQLAQVIGLGIILLMILLFRDKISVVTGSLLASFESDDIKVNPPTKTKSSISSPSPSIPIPNKDQP